MVGSSAFFIFRRSLKIEVMDFTYSAISVMVLVSCIWRQYSMMLGKLNVSKVGIFCLIVQRNLSRCKMKASLLQFIR